MNRIRAGALTAITTVSLLGGTYVNTYPQTVEPLSGMNGSDDAVATAETPYKKSWNTEYAGTLAAGTVVSIDCTYGGYARVYVQAVPEGEHGMTSAVWVDPGRLGIIPGHSDLLGMQCTGPQRVMP